MSSLLDTLLDIMVRAWALFKPLPLPWRMDTILLVVWISQALPTKDMELSLSLLVTVLRCRPRTRILKPCTEVSFITMEWGT